MIARLTAVMLLGLALLWATAAPAQTQAPPTPQFAFLGFIQEATLDTAGTICTPGSDPATGLPSNRLRGGTITVNGIKMIVPCNTLMQLPAATMTWGDLFDVGSSTPVGGLNVIGTVPANPTVSNVKTGLALSDYPMPFPSFEVSVTGNVAGKNADGTDRYVVGLIAPVSQQGLNGSSGIVSYIDYTFGSFRVGGIGNIGCDASLPGGGPTCTGALVQFNDPVGRWGLVHSPDPRYSGDYENTTIHISTGIPLCIPRVAPPGYDPKCPMSNGPDVNASLPNTGNRPLNGDPRFPTDPFIAPGAPLKIFQMPAPVLRTHSVTDPVTGVVTQVPDIDPATGEPINTVTPDAYKQVPLMVGDQVIYSGTLFKINPLATAGTDPVTGAPIPDNSAANSYISAHTVDDVMEITTAPGIPPAYVFVEGVLIGTGGATIQGLVEETSTRLTAVGFTTDPTRLVEVNAEDVNPCTGETSLRLLATTDPATQAFRTRFVHRVLGGLFMPPTRNYVMVSQTQQIDPATGKRVPLIAANGIETGRFLLPNFEYIFAENHRFGDPLVPNNFQDLPFLALGSGPIDGFGSGSPVLGQLDPWPGSAPYSGPPSKVNCANFGHTPSVNAGPDLAWGAGTTVTLSGNVTWDNNSDPTQRTLQWTQVGGDTVTLSSPNSLTTTFTAPATPQTLSFTLTATDNFGPGSDSVNTVVVQPSDLVQFVTALYAVQRGPRGNFGKLTVTATTNDPTALLTLIETATDGTVQNWGTGAANPSAPGTFDWQEIKGVLQPAKLTITSTKGGTATVNCGQPNAKGQVTCP